MKFEDWIEQNNLSVERISNSKIQIQGVGIFLVLECKDKIIDEDFCFILSEDESDSLNFSNIDFICFKFGEDWYYCEKKYKKNKYGLDSYIPDFNLFKNIGETNREKILDFVHLGIHTEYELLNGSGSCENWVKKAKFLKHDCIGICDKNTLSGTLCFQLACEKEKVKPIIGETITIANNFDIKLDNQELFDMKLYVINDIGWQNLLMINKYINVDYNGFIPDFLLEKYGEGLCCVIDKNSLFDYLKEDKTKCVKWLKNLKKVFSEVYFQIDTVEYFSEKSFLKHLQCIDVYIKDYINIVKPILINDSYYIDKDSFKIKKYLNQSANVVNLESDKQYYKDVHDTLDSFSEWIDSDELYNCLIHSISNTVSLSEKINFKIRVGERNLPKYKNKDVESLFFTEIEKGFSERLSDLSEQEKNLYFERLEKECDVIVKAGLCDYFMILWDIMKYCSESNIQTGTGRGSVCGSLVAYLLKITEIDPIKYGLMFERFLNETRVSGERAKTADALPDIDLDFQTARREDVRIYIEKKYGVNHVACVSTYIKMKLKTCLKDFSKLHGFDFQTMNKITKEIDDQIEYKFSDLIKYATQSNLLYKFIQENPDLIKIIRDTLQQCKASSVHPSAIVIFPEEDINGNKLDIFNWLPVKKIGNVLVTEWEGKYIDKCGFLKEDILGLSQLDKFQTIINEIFKNKKKKIILSDIDTSETKVYDFFKRGWCEDVFQFGTTGLMNYCRQVKPSKITDLIAMNALYRPGPMDSNAHNDFSDIKTGKKKPKFDVGMEEITEETLSLYVYQEQIMKAAVVGGLTEVESDIMRTAIKKKDFEQIKIFEEKFIKNYSKRVGEENAIKTWEKLIAFSGYGFNKSHAAAYTVMSYYSQWFKVNFPLEFWTTSLQFATETEIPFRISEMNKIGLEIEVRPPDINYSGMNFTNDGENKIFFSLTKINGVGEIAVNDILRARQSGKFYDFEDFLSRITSKTNSGVVSKLIICGAFDLMYNIENVKQRKDILLNYLNMKKKELPKEIEGMNLDSSEEWVIAQKKLTGFGDINYRDMIVNIVSKRIFNMYIESDIFSKQKEGEEVTIVGRVISVFCKEIKTGVMARIQIDSNNNVIDCALWPDCWEKLGKQELYYKNKLICLNGLINKFAGKKTLVSSKLTKLYEI